ncbi:hypothetical protein GWI33_006298 [Rhynchophorus ferrugineus]|uniref:Uncharacterized protein n=1 Tax=Rhynchophorus ferrugineus TaxID=354439 RepID=A0A834IG68_RHYFE|nr:hypothetical protein GWI33_006298 [Rhynchophorus ferrugineus]
MLRRSRRDRFTERSSLALAAPDFGQYQSCRRSWRSLFFNSTCILVLFANKTAVRIVPINPREFETLTDDTRHRQTNERTDLGRI